MTGQDNFKQEVQEVSNKMKKQMRTEAKKVKSAREAGEKENQKSGGSFVENIKKRMTFPPKKEQGR